MSPNFTVCLCKAKATFWFYQPPYPMIQFQKLWIFAMLLFFSNAYSQYTGVINSNRPGFSESPYSVGTGVFQLETSIFHRKVKLHPTFARPQTTGVDFLLRAGLFMERLELIANFTYQRDQIAFKNIFTSSYFTTGFGRSFVGMKYLIYEQPYKDKSKEIRSWKRRMSYDWNRFIPSVALYGGMNVGFVNKVLEASKPTPKFGVLLQNNLTHNLNIVSNVFYDKIGSNAPEMSYILTATYNLNDRWSTFFENQAVFSKLITTSNLGSGVAFLYNKNLQFNSSLRFLSEGKASGVYASFGISYRIDKHADSKGKANNSGSPLELRAATYETEKKGFFSRLFGIFKRKGRKTASGGIKLKQKTIRSIQKNTTNKEALNKPLRTRPKRVRKKRVKLSTKEIEKKKKKNARKAAKEIDKELKKLEKEQRKLERELKKEEEKKKREEAKKKKKSDTKKKDENNKIF